jgi:hypothetical protein
MSYYGPLCHLPELTRDEVGNVVWEFLFAIGLINSDAGESLRNELKTWCHVHDDKAKDAAFAYCLLGYVAMLHYKSQKYYDSATFYATFNYKYGEDQWGKLVGELVNAMCDSDRAIVFSYGYVSGCVDKSDVIMSVSNPLIATAISSAKNHDLDAFNITDCYSEFDKCSEIHHIKTNLDEFTETGLLGRIYIWAPWKDTTCPSPKIVFGEGGWGGGEGGGGGGCSIVFPGNWEAVGAIGIVYLYLIVRRSRKGGKK